MSAWPDSGAQKNMRDHANFGELWVGNQSVFRYPSPLRQNYCDGHNAKLPRCSLSRLETPYSAMWLGPHPDDPALGIGPVRCLKARLKSYLVILSCFGLNSLAHASSARLAFFVWLQSTAEPVCAQIDLFAGPIGDERCFAGTGSNFGVIVADRQASAGL